MTSRILIVMAASDWAAAEPALQEAHRLAAEAQRLSCGLCLAKEPSREDERAMRRYPAVRYLAPGWDPWQDAEALWRGENHILIVPPEVRFTLRWDHRLLQALRDCPGQESALTGYLPTRTDPVDAVCPVAAAGFDENGAMTFAPGTPLRYAKDSLRCAFLHTDFCFAPAAFFHAVREEGPPYFLAAFRRRWQLYTLREPVLRLTQSIPLLPCAVRPETEGLERFERFFEVSFTRKQLSSKARMGIWTPDLTVPTSVPLKVRLQERLRAIDNAVSRLDPLCVTACFTTVGTVGSEDALARFRYLASLQRLQMVCYAEPQSTQRLRGIHPFIRTIRPGVGFASPVPVTREDAARWARLSKPFLMENCRGRDRERTHYVWIDFDYQGYPVYSKAALDWQNVCGERIVLATVNGIPDLSMFTVPRDLLPQLCQEITARCAHYAQKTGALPSERALWKGLMADLPEWFDPVELPGRRELFSLTMLSSVEEW